MPPNSKSSCGINSFCAGAFLIFVGSVLLCGFGFMVVLPHSATKLWPTALCHVTNSSYDYTKCMCHKQTSSRDSTCSSKYPCLRIAVKYRIGDDVVTRTRRDVPRSSNDTDIVDTTTTAATQNTTYGGVQSNVTAGNYSEHVITESTTVTVGYNRSASTNDSSDWVSATLFRGWNDAFHGKCSLHECGMEEWNVKATASFKSLWGRVGQTFSCYVDPRSPGNVIIQRTSSTTVLHAVLWPSVSLALGLLLWLGLCVGCCKMERDVSSEYTNIKT